MTSIEKIKFEREQEILQMDSLMKVVDQLHEIFPIVEPNYVNVRLTYAINDYRVEWDFKGKTYSLTARTPRDLENKIIKVIERYDNK